MRTITLGLAVAAAVMAGPALNAKPRLTPEQRLEKLLEGRTPGKPQSCISTFDSRDMQIIDGTALVYRSGSTLYVNKPRNAEDLDSDDIMVIRSSGSQFCRLDMVNMVDRTGRFTTGFISLGDFVPYKRVASRD